MVVASFNHFAIARQNSSRRSSSPTSPRRLTRTAAQIAMHESIGNRVARFGSPSPEATPEASFRELMDVRDLYSQGPKHLAPFGLSKLKAAMGSTAPRPIASALPPGPKVFLDNFATCIEKTSAEIAAMEPGTLPAAPYWDPTLRQSRRQRRMLFKILFDLKLIAFRATTKSFAGFFFVRKKSGMIRMVVDSRIANGCRRRPPRTRPSSAASLAGLDLSDAAIDCNGLGEVLGISPHGNEGDVVDCFYNFTVFSLASWFARDDPGTVDEWRLLGFDVPEIYDDVLGRTRPPRPGETLWPCVEAMSMGWSWSLHLASEAVCHCAHRARGHRAGDELRERSPAPSLGVGRPITGVYVDSITVIGAKASDARSSCHHIRDQAAADRLPVEWMHPILSPSSRPSVSTSTFARAPSPTSRREFGAPSWPAKLS